MQVFRNGASTVGSPKPQTTVIAAKNDWSEAEAVRLMLQSGTPKLIVSLVGTVLWASDSARAQLVRPSPLIIRNDKLVCETKRAQQTLAHLLETISDQGRRSILRGRKGANWVLLKGLPCDPEEGEAIYLECSLSEPCRSVIETGLAEEFDLTHSEARVLDLFSRCMRPKDISDDLGISVNTVRSHMKKIYGKLSVNSNLELLQLTRAFCDN